MKNFRRAQQRLGRDAAPVQTNAAEIGFLDNCCLEAELRRTDCGDIAAGTGADDDDVEGGVGHGYSLLSSSPSPLVGEGGCAPLGAQTGEGGRVAESKITARTDCDCNRMSLFQKRRTRNPRSDKS